MEPFVETLRPALLTAHLLAGAIAGGGPLLCAALRLLPRLRASSDAALRRLAVWSVGALLLGLVLGGVSALLVAITPDSGYRAAALSMPDKAYGYLVAEWLFTAVLYTVYVALWRRMGARPWLHGLIAFVGATNLLYHFPTIMVVLRAVAEDPLLMPEPSLTRGVFRRLIVMPEQLARTAHYWSLCLLAPGVAAVLAGAPPAGSEGSRNPLAVAGGVWSLGGLALAMLTGVVALTQIAAGPQRALLGGDAVAGVVFGAGVLAALVLGHTLLPIAMGDGPRHAATRATALLVIVVGCMTAAGGWN